MKQIRFSCFRALATFTGRAVAALFLLSNQVSKAQFFSTALAINNSSEIAGGQCVDNCSGFHATLTSRLGIQDFGTFGGPASVAFGLNDIGDVVGQSDTAALDSNGVDYISLAFLANSDGVHNLGTLPGYHHSQAFAINNRGQIVGFSYNFDPLVPSRTIPNFHAFFYAGGVMRDLGTLGGSISVAFGINDLGQIVGRSRNAAGEVHAFLYERGVMTDLGTLGGTFSTARALNAQGWIVGGSRLPNQQMRAFVVIRGVMRELGTLGGTYSEAFAINNAGVIVGAAHILAEEPHAFAYHNGTMTDLGTLGGAYSVAFGVNDLGHIVGESETSSGEVHGFVYREGVMQDLSIP
jgi:probable HAF family extracellular repeat protein